jgi:hypothetical protein
MVFVLEDLHWADTASLEMLTYVARHSADAPIVAIATTRPGPTVEPSQDRIFNELMRAPDVVRIDLGPLSSDEIRSLIEMHVSQDPILGHFAQVVIDRSEGNPFLALQLAASAHPEGLPTRLRDILLGQLQGLDVDTLGICRLLAAWGSQTSYDDIRAAAHGTDVDRALRTAAERRLIMRTSNDRFALTHGLLGRGHLRGPSTRRATGDSRSHRNSTHAARGHQCGRGC